MLTGEGCSTCHTPHASRQKQLVRGTPVQVCGQCHTDTVALQQRSIKSLEKEQLCEPVRKGECNQCHSPHGAQQVLLFEASSSIELCGRCHEWQTHSTHPIGEDVVDSRNINLTLDCLSCHRGCGTTDNPMMLSFATTYDLCVSCHVDRRR
jgi:predicted CXXCH cytochrome family protein